MVVVIVLLLAGWTVASVVVAALASTVFRGARNGAGTLAVPPEYVDLTDRERQGRSVSYAADQPGQGASR
jgi:hypothetical protein